MTHPFAKPAWLPRSNLKNGITCHIIDWVCSGIHVWSLSVALITSDDEPMSVKPVVRVTTVEPSNLFAVYNAFPVSHQEGIFSIERAVLIRKIERQQFQPSTLMWENRGLEDTSTYKHRLVKQHRRDTTLALDTYRMMASNVSVNFYIIPMYNKKCGFVGIFLCP